MTYDDRESLTQGADYQYVATVAVNAADPLVLAWYTVKTDLSVTDPGSLQKKVTVTNVVGTGQITADGSTTDGLATVRFDLTSTDTTGLTARSYFFDVKVKTSSGAFAYGAQGRLEVHRNVTTSTS